ncbi:putative pectinesterase/pectinesterase inhibitor 45, partial [Phtheirospermum japonicum]
PNIVVAKDGSGQFKTIGEAIAAYPAGHQGRFSIYIKAGVYDEEVKIKESWPNVLMYGDGIGKTIVTGSKSGTDLFETTTFACAANDAYGFIAKWITFRNTAGPTGQPAPAFRSQGDESAMFECSFEGYQDTLFYQLKKQFYGNCRIYGTIDFIFGYGEALIQNSDIIVRKPQAGHFNVITADGREHQQDKSGLVLQNCRIFPDNSWSPIGLNVKTYLGRPWKAFARTVVMQSYLDKFIEPEGWTAWDNTSNHKTCGVFEYSNRGPGADTEHRSKLFPNFKVLQKMEAAKFTVDSFLAGETWLSKTGIPYSPGL